jgi:hypothetical protein
VVVEGTQVSSDRIDYGHTPAGHCR